MSRNAASECSETVLRPLLSYKSFLALVHSSIFIQNLVYVIKFMKFKLGSLLSCSKNYDVDKNPNWKTEARLKVSSRAADLHRTLKTKVVALLL